MLIVLGAIVLIAGVLVTLSPRLPFKIGQLPGDIVIRGRNSTLYLPLASSLILSALATFLFWLVGRR